MRNKLPHHWLFYLTCVLLWAKTYLVQRFALTLNIDSLYQEIILLISPLASILFFLWLAFTLGKKRVRLALWSMYALLSFVLYANLIYYRFFSDFITLPVLFQTKNMSDLGGSIRDLINYSDLFLFLDLFLLTGLLIFKKTASLTFSKLERKRLIIWATIILVVNIGMAEIERPQLLTRAFDRQIIVKSLGTYTYQVYDLALQSKITTQKVFAKTEDLEEIKAYVAQDQVIPNDEYFGIAKGKNVIVVSLESTQSFVLNRKINGQEITPFLNDLLKDSIYFTNFYHQTGQGKTSDSEFLIENSLYPLARGAVFFTHGQNTYRGLPTILGEHNYYSAVFHANDKTFWNRDVMYESLGYTRFFSKDDYHVTEENSVGWGLKDLDFFEQSLDYLKELPQPFYTKFITLTNHHPFELGMEDQFIPEYTSSDKTVNRYLPTVSYMDYALSRFFDLLKINGLYEDSIIILYGDHYGISENHYKGLGELLGKEITPFDSVQLQQVPLLIHIPGVKGKVISQPAGQIDLKPTILYLLGIEENGDIQFGDNLFAERKDPLVVLRNGSFITNDYIFTNNVCYNHAGEEVEKEACEANQKRAQTDLYYSDRIILGDLLKFAETEEEL